MRDLCVASGIADDHRGYLGRRHRHRRHRASRALRRRRSSALSATDFNSYGTVSIAEGAPKRVNGKMSASSNAPGLGIDAQTGMCSASRCRLIG
jgi:hypothetical protein